MNNELISELSKLTLQRNALKRTIDRNYYIPELRDKLFFQLKEVDKNIKRVKFKLRMEKMLNANNNTDSTKNEKE